MLWSLLSAEASSSAAKTGSPDWTSYVMVGVLVVLMIAFMVYSKRAQAKRQKETMDMLDAMKPGNKVKTIGGICGVVVEICPDENAFILETGSETTGKSYIKFDKQDVYQTDAVVEKKEEAPVFEEATPVEEAPVAEEEATAEEATNDNE